METIYERAKRCACEEFYIPIELLDTKSKKREIVQCRQVAMSLIKYHFPEICDRIIGENIGNKDHSNVVYSRKTINNLRETDKMFRKQYESINERFGKDIYLYKINMDDISDRLLKAMEKIRKITNRRFWKDAFGFMEL